MPRPDVYYKFTRGIVVRDFAFGEEGTECTLANGDYATLRVRLTNVPGDFPRVFPLNYYVAIVRGTRVLLATNRNQIMDVGRARVEFVAECDGANEKTVCASARNGSSATLLVREAPPAPWRVVRVEARARDKRAVVAHYDATGAPRVFFRAGGSVLRVREACDGLDRLWTIEDSETVYPFDQWFA